MQGLTINIRVLLLLVNMPWWKRFMSKINHYHHHTKTLTLRCKMNDNFPNIPVVFALKELFLSEELNLPHVKMSLHCFVLQSGLTPAKFCLKNV